MMENTQFMRGIGVGVAVGAALAVAMRPRHKSVKSTAGKAIKAVGEVVENISDAMGM